MSVLDIEGKVAARLRLEEDGSLSNKRVEKYALLLADEVVSKNTAQIICFGGHGKSKSPSGTYMSKVNGSAVFKRRLEALMSEKAALVEEGPWGELEWQTKQLYRKAAAINDLGKMASANDMLFKLLLRKDRLAGKSAPEPESDDPKEDGAPRGRGAPPVPVPDIEGQTQNDRAARLLAR